MNERSNSPAVGNGGTGSAVTERVAEVGAEAGTQVKAVAREATDHVRDLVDRARSDVQQQARERSGQAADSLRTLSDRLSALAGGRPEAAGPLVDYLQDAGDRVTRLAGRLDQGPDAVLGDVRSFARRRPLVFLGAASAIGFAVGRMLRSGASSGSSGDGLRTADAAALPPPAARPTNLTAADPTVVMSSPTPSGPLVTGVGEP